MTDVEQSFEASRIQEMMNRLQRMADRTGYHLNPDIDFTMQLVESLMINGQRYGYWSCPCRLASGDRSADQDIICPCDYRDPDLAEWGACYCGLYVSEEIAQGERHLQPVPERRQVQE